MASLFSWAVAAVVIAAALDIAANLLLARSAGFRHLVPGTLALILVGLAFYVLSLAVRSMDLAVAYALWGGFGILGTSLGGWFLLGQRLSISAWLGIALLIGGMTALRLS